MKKVYTKSEDVIHLFAQKEQSEARCSNVFFEGNKLYSYGYHYLLAEFLDDNTLMINDSGYSVTTSKHINEVKYATRQYRQFFKTETDLDMVFNIVKYNLTKLAKAKKPYLYIDPIFNLFDKLNEYLKYSRTLTKVKKSDKYKFIAKTVSILNADADKFQEELNKERVKELKRKEREQKRKLKVSLEKFNNFEIDSFRIGEEDYLRLSKDATKVETSQNVKVDVKDAKVLYTLIKAKRDIKGHRIGNYTVKSLNGVLTIGCHQINIDSVHEVGSKL